MHTSRQPITVSRPQASHRIPGGPFARESGNFAQSAAETLAHAVRNAAGAGRNPALAAEHATFQVVEDAIRADRGSGGGSAAYAAATAAHGALCAVACGAHLCRWGV